MAQIDDGFTIKGINILTHLRHVERVTRFIDENFFEHVGMWVKLNNDGSVSNVETGTPSKINKLLISSKRRNIYESHDTAVGRVTTMESIGTRCIVPSTNYAGTINFGDRLIVSVTLYDEGKLVSAEEYTVPGDYEVVARCEQINTNYGWMIFRTISPEIITIT